MTTKSQMTTEACNELAAKLTKLGYRVYFQYDLFRGFSFTTCMKPSRDGCSGWQLEVNQSYEGMLYPTIPRWSKSNGVFLTEEQKLNASKHSNYALFVCEDC